VTRRFGTWADLLCSGAEESAEEVAFGVLTDSHAPDTITREAFVDRALRVSSGLHSVGVRKGSVVVLAGEPSISWAVAFGAVLLAGGLPAPISPRSTPAELNRVMALSGSRHAIASSQMAALAPTSDWTTINWGPADHGAPNVQEMLELNAISPVLCRDDDAAVVLQTSGTTGLPKCVVHTHRSHLEFIDRWTKLTMNQHDRILSFLPMNHQSGLLLSWISAYSVGAPTYQLNRFSLSGFWDTVHALDITWTTLMEPVPTYLLNAPPRPDDRTHALRFVAGSRRPEEVAALQERFGIRLERPYGSTETTIVAIALDQTRTAARSLTPDEAARCSGPPLLDWSLRITLDDGSVAGPMTTGSLEVRGPSLFACYLNDTEATEKVMSEDGWFTTGDRAYLNEFGELFFVERSGNTIRRSGENVSAAEVEAVLLEHPGVSDTCVVAVPDELRGQEVRACIVCAPGTSVTAEEIFEHCRAALSGYKVPRYLDFWDEFPRTATFKVSRTALESDPATWIDRYQLAAGAS
jgi:crotonobetaine/carnitine-CoA ligase